MKTLLILLATSAVALAGSWKVKWNPNIPSTGVKYRVCKVGSDNTLIPIGTTADTNMTVSASPGDVLTLVAFNQFGDSPPADYITVPTKMIVEVQETFDLVKKDTIATLVQDLEDGKIFDVILEVPKDGSRITVEIRQKNGGDVVTVARLYRKKKVKAFYMLKYYYGT